MIWHTQPSLDGRRPWVLVANAARARLFERDPANDALRELADFVHPASRAKGTALGHDRPGQTVNGSARERMEPPTSPKDREVQHFAQQLADELESAARSERLSTWVLFASSPFLGVLKAALGHVAAARLIQATDRDLTALQGRALELRVGELLPRIDTDEAR